LRGVDGGGVGTEQFERHIKDSYCRNDYVRNPIKF
jgi:hypothetical protein